ncbi:MAG: NAD+ synthase [Patescibacteria group bacterium]|nr:NAD+ synthase [Patescibacteria group bacterium]MDE2590731.1 NAD+ synthase [Patescibacteria group bacterium]
MNNASSISSWIAETVKNAEFANVVIGLSGGIDSALSTTLAVSALGSDHVYPLLLPYKDMHTKALSDAVDVIQFLKIPTEHVTQIDIAESVDATLTHMKNIDDIRRGNVMARVRMIYLFDFAKKYTALVCGTENKTEHYLGYFTRFGDEASDIEPIRNLYKTEVWEMAKELGISQQIIEKAPTAGLWEGQTDEKELGFSYQEADTVLRYYFDEHLTFEQINAKKVVREQTISAILERVRKNEFKHALPYIYQ